MKTTHHSPPTTHHLPPTTRRGGFTLIELVMVLVILTALAALIVPVVDFIRRTSDKSSASFAMKQIVENLGMYRTITGAYPSKLDSLMEGTGAGNATTRLTTLRLGDKAEQVTLTAAELNRMDDMFDNVMQHDVANAYRGFQGNSGRFEVPTGNQTGAVQTDFLVVSDDDRSGLDIIDSIYPNASTNPSGTFPNIVDVVTSGEGFIAVGDGADDDATTTADNETVRLLVLGVGPSNEAVGQTMQSAPAYAAVNGLEDYNRFFALFAVYQNFTVSRRPQLKAALDSTGDFLDQELIEVAENTLE